jgi:hypothetical protein
MVQSYHPCQLYAPSFFSLKGVVFVVCSRTVDAEFVVQFRSRTHHATMPYGRVHQHRAAERVFDEQLDPTYPHRDGVAADVHGSNISQPEEDCTVLFFVAENIGAFSP